MKVYRVTSMAALACAGLALTACSGGLTTVTPGPASSTSAASNPATEGAGATAAAASSSAAASASTGPAAGSPGTVTLGGGIGAFPIPPGTDVIEDGASGSSGAYSIAFSGVTASEVDTFYVGSLPSYGYTITENEGVSGSVSGTTIKFTGHGFTGDIGGMSGTGSLGGVSLGGITSGSVTGVTFTPA